MTLFRNIYGKACLRLVLLTALLIGFCACEDHICTGPKRVFIVYSIGFNNLSNYLKQDIEELSKSYSSVPCNSHVVIYSHSTKTRGSYSTPNSPVLIELKKTKSGGVVRDTIVTYDPNTVSASKETLHNVLSYIKDRYQEAEYSILFSSHGTGWTPADYCNDPNFYEKQYSDTWIPRMRTVREHQPYWGVTPEDGGPVVKGFGIQNITTGTYHEMNITAMKDAFPMKMNAIIFDACFMGGIEVAYELRNNTDFLVASQTEILADGMEYTTMLKYIFNRNGDLKGFCENFFNYYNDQSGQYKSATISLIDCTRLGPLAEVCSEIFDAHRTRIAALEGSMKIQRYYRLTNAGIHQWFYDLEDIAMFCDLSEDHKERLKTALEGCVVYKAATPEFISDIKLEKHSGLSMYLPFTDRGYLNNFYRTLEWNKATGLVQ